MPKSTTKSPGRAPGTVPAASRPGSAPRLSRAERYAAGKALREACPREAHAGWKAPAGPARTRSRLVLAAEKGRMPELLPLRHGRMVRSAFTFYRGSALTMAADLASTPATGVRVQCCGDAHLCNFGGFATPERRIIFSINDLDETLPAPWEWDVKRLAASFVVACRDNGLSDAAAKDVATTCVRTYRESMAEFSQMKTLELWYQALGADDLVAGIKDPAFRKRAIKRLQKEQAKSVAEDIFPKLVEHKGEMPVIKDQLPTIFHAEGHPPGEVQKAVRDALAGVPRDPARLPTSPCSTATSSGTPPSRWWGSAASGPPAGCSSSWPARATPSSSRSRRRAPRCWSRTPARASSPTTASAS